MHDLVGDEQQKGFEGVIPPVNIVTHEDVAPLRWLTNCLTEAVPRLNIFWTSKNCPWTSPTMLTGAFTVTTLLSPASISMAFSNSGLRVCSENGLNELI